MNGALKKMFEAFQDKIIILGAKFLEINSTLLSYVICKKLKIPINNHLSSKYALDYYPSPPIFIPSYSSVSLTTLMVAVRHKADETS